MQKSSGSESIFDIEKAARTKGSEKTPDYSGVDAKCNDIMNKLSQTNKLDEANKIIEKLTKDNINEGITSLSDKLIETSDKLGSERADILIKMLEYSLSGMPPEEMETKLDELIPKANELVNKVNTLFANANQAEKLNEGVKKYIEGGGDPDKLNLEKFNETMMPNSEIDSIANGSPNDNSAGTAAGGAAQGNQGNKKAGLTNFFQHGGSTQTQNTDNN